MGSALANQYATLLEEVDADRYDQVIAFADYPISEGYLNYALG